MHSKIFPEMVTFEKLIPTKVFAATANTSADYSLGTETVTFRYMMWKVMHPETEMVFSPNMQCRSETFLITMVCLISCDRECKKKVIHINFWRTLMVGKGDLRHAISDSRN